MNAGTNKRIYTHTQKQEKPPKIKTKDDRRTRTSTSNGFGHRFHMQMASINIMKAFITAQNVSLCWVYFKACVATSLKIDAALIGVGFVPCVA